MAAKPTGEAVMTAIVFVTHPNPVRVSLAFLTGALVAMVVGTTIYYLLAGTIDLGDPSDAGSSGSVIPLVLAGLLVLLALRTYVHRETIEPSRPGAPPAGRVPPGSSCLAEAQRPPVRSGDGLLVGEDARRKTSHGPSGSSGSTQLP